MIKMPRFIALAYLPLIKILRSIDLSLAILYLYKIIKSIIISKTQKIGSVFLVFCLYFIEPTTYIISNRQRKVSK